MMSLRFSGIQRTSMVDYPGKICAILFTQGCNFRCPFCHNPELVKDKVSGDMSYSDEKILDMLLRRKYLVDAVTISGGEPTLHKELLNFIVKLKNYGFFVKLDTNGTNPKFLEKSLPYLDYIAMDIKASKDRYLDAAGITNESLLSKVNDSIKSIKNSGKDYEFRTTILPEFISFEDAKSMSKGLKGSKKIILQQFQREDTLDPKFRNKKIYDPEDFEKLVEIFKENIEIVETKGIK